MDLKIDKIITYTALQFKRIENKGREYGSYIKSGEYRWFVRETGKIPVILISFSFYID